MRETSFHCPFRPRGWERTGSGNGNRYTQPKDRRFRSDVATLAAAAHRGEPFTGPCELKIVAVFAIAKSASRKRQAELLGRPHCIKPDGDNILKAIGDALNGIVWADDSQAYSVSLRKTWGVEDGFRVTAREVAKKGDE